MEKLVSIPDAPRKQWDLKPFSLTNRTAKRAHCTGIPGISSCGEDSQSHQIAKECRHGSGVWTTRTEMNGPTGAAAPVGDRVLHDSDRIHYVDG